MRYGDHAALKPHLVFPTPLIASPAQNSMQPGQVKEKISRRSQQPSQMRAEPLLPGLREPLSFLQVQCKWSRIYL